MKTGREAKEERRIREPDLFVDSLNDDQLSLLMAIMLDVAEDYKTSLLWKGFRDAIERRKLRREKERRTS